MRTWRVWTVLAGVALGFTLSYLGPVDAARNSSGTYSLPAGQPVVSGTTISSSTFNTLTSDVASELTDSLSRSGKGPMLAPLVSVAGTVSAPGVCFVSDTDTGLYRIGANNPGMAAGGVKVQEWATTGSTFPLGVTVTQSQTDAYGITTTGNGTGHGLNATSTGGIAVYAQGGGSSAGVQAVGGATGPGAKLFAGTSATGADRTDALVLDNGDLDMAAVADPNRDEALSDTLTPKNIIKAHGRITTGASPAISSDAFNVANVSCGSSNITVTLASAMSGSSYSLVVSGENGSVLMVGAPASTTTFTVSAYTPSSGAQVNLCTNDRPFHFMVSGSQ